MQVSGELNAPAALPLGRIVWHPLNTRLGGSQSPYEQFAQKENLLPLSGIEPRFLYRPTHALVTTLTELFRQ
jgi:hypothetical protein